MSERFECECGFQFIDNTDNLSYMARLIPDKAVWDEVWDAIDDAIEKSGPSAQEKEAACMKLRGQLRFRRIWQCRKCGALYLEDGNQNRYRFVPELPECPKVLLSNRESGEDMTPLGSRE